MEYALVLLFGIVFGGSVVWFFERWHDGDVEQWQQVVGQLQSELNRRSILDDIPDEEK